MPEHKFLLNYYRKSPNTERSANYTDDQLEVSLFQNAQYEYFGAKLRAYHVISVEKKKNR